MPTDQQPHPPEPPPRHNLELWQRIATAMATAGHPDLDTWMTNRRLYLSWDECQTEIRDLTGINVVRATLLNWYPELRKDQIRELRRLEAKQGGAQ